MEESERSFLTLNASEKSEDMVWMLLDVLSSLALLLNIAVLCLAIRALLFANN